jgi:hypothetical protein
MYVCGGKPKSRQLMTGFYTESQEESGNLTITNRQKIYWRKGAQQGYQKLSSISSLF